MYEAKVIADSLSIPGGVRLTTVQATMPRIILAELNTHRVMSRGSASSRAIPVEKRIQAVLDNPFVPAAFGANQKGMQAGADLDEDVNERSRLEWLTARNNAVDSARFLAEWGVHKQWANRLLEPFSWTTVVITATEWENFFNLRCSSMAQPEIREIAERMRKARTESVPKRLGNGEWHLPYVQPDELHLDLAGDYLVRLSTARCARVSYLNQEGKRDHAADIALYDRLYDSRHMGPTEHPAMVDAARADEKFIGNFAAPWVQHRKQLNGEAVAPPEK